MKYRRHETFRFQFEEPLVCTFRIIKIDNKDFKSKIGKAYISDISEGGLKLASSFLIPIDEKRIELEITFTLNKEELVLTGVLVWKKDLNKDFSYGVQFTSDTTMKRKLIEELKIFSRGIVVIKKKQL